MTFFFVFLDEKKVKKKVKKKEFRRVFFCRAINFADQARRV